MDILGVGSLFSLARLYKHLHRQSSTGDVNVIGGEMLPHDENFSNKKLLPDLPPDAPLPPAANTKKPSAQK